MRIGKTKFSALTADEQARIAKLPSNRANMKGTIAMCMPHSRLDDLSDSEWV